MSRDIFISYSTKDTQIAIKARDYLEDNGLSCWMAPRDIKTSDNYAQGIMEGLINAKIIVLIFSKNSHESYYVTEEIDNAFSRDKSILPFKIDETLPEGKMEFFLRHNQWLDASDNPESHFKELLDDARRLCEGVKIQKTTEPHKTLKNQKQVHKRSLISKYRLQAILIILLMISITGVLAFAHVNDKDSENGITIDYIGLDDDSSKQYSWKYSYFVFGSVSSNLTDNYSNAKICFEFMDESGKIVKINESEITNVDGNLLASVYVDENNIAKVSVKVYDADDNVIYSTQSDNIIKQ